MKAVEVLPPLEVDIVFWDGKVYDGTQGHPYVAPSHVDDRGRKHGIIARSDGQTVDVVEGDAVIGLPDGTYTAMSADKARASFEIADDGKKAKSKALPSGAKSEK